MNTPKSDWYRQPVVWLFLLLLGVTVIACIGLMVVAIKSDDGLVDDNYYQRGNQIGQELALDRQAAKLGLSAKLLLADDGRQLRVLLVPLPVQPNPLKLTLTHAARAGENLQLTLRAGEDGLFKASLDRTVAGERWLAVLDDPLAGWRMRGEGPLPVGGALDLKPAGQ